MESKVLREESGLFLVEVTDDDGNIKYEIQNSHGKVITYRASLSEIESIFADMIRRIEIEAKRRRNNDRGGPSL